MSKFFNIVFLFFISFSSLYSSEYKVSILSSLLPSSFIHSINDNGEFLITLPPQIPIPSPNTFFFYDKSGFLPIETGKKSNRPEKLNNMGLVLGYSSTEGSIYTKPFIWSKDGGTQWVHVFGSERVQVNDLNDFGQIVGSYIPSGTINEGDRPFLWQNGEPIDMGIGSNFAKLIENLGYHVMGISFQSINNKGEIVGSFAYGKFDIRKQKYITIGSKIFYWNGNINIVNLPGNHLTIRKIKINNNGSIMIIACYLLDPPNTYLWKSDNNISIIENFEGISLNDSDVILVKCSKPPEKYKLQKYALWRDGKINNFEDLLNVQDINQIAPIYSDNYAIERLSDFSGINNKGEIACTGSIWGDYCPCLLEPINNQNPNQETMN